jgi:hypothetical protein
MCSAQYYLPISTFTNYTNTAISPVSGVASNITLRGITTATNLGASTVVSNLTVSGVATINYSNIVAKGTTTATNIQSINVTTTNLYSVNVFGTNQVTSYGTLNCNGGGDVNAGGNINVGGNIQMNGGSGVLLLGPTGSIKIWNNSTYSVANWTSSDFFINPPSSSGLVYFNYNNGTGGVKFGNGASAIVGSIDSSGNFTNKGYILTGSAISCNVVTNNGLIWYAYATNATPTFLTGPNGSICTTTNGQLFVRSNATWVLK